jgi:hypothetical protein
MACLQVAISKRTSACAVLLAVLLVGMQAAGVVRADSPIPKAQTKTPAKPLTHSSQQKPKSKSKKKVVQKSALYAVTLPTLKGIGDSIVEPAPAVIARLTEQFAPRRSDRVDLDSALQRANDEHPIEFALDDNLNLEWHFKSYPTADRFPDVGMKVGLKYRF